MTAPNVKTGPSLRKLESDLEVNKTTLHNWKQNRPKLYEFMFLIDQKKKLEDRITTEQKKVS
jgi:exonuclease I